MPGKQSHFGTQAQYKLRTVGTRKTVVTIGRKQTVAVTKVV